MITFICSACFWFIANNSRDIKWIKISTINLYTFHLFYFSFHFLFFCLLVFIRFSLLFSLIPYHKCFILAHTFWNWRKPFNDGWMAHEKGSEWIRAPCIPYISLFRCLKISIFLMFGLFVLLLFCFCFLFAFSKYRFEFVCVCVQAFEWWNMLLKMGAQIHQFRWKYKRTSTAATTNMKHKWIWDKLENG